MQLLGKDLEFESGQIGSGVCTFETRVTSLAKFIPRYFILFVVTVNGIVFLSSLSVSLLLDYRNATEFL